MNKNRLGIGIIGSGFNARFHLQAFVGVRGADIVGVWSPTERNAAEAAALACSLDVGETKVYRSIGDMVADPAIDALWLCGPNLARVENVEEIVNAIERGRGTLKGLAWEKPLARNVAEAKRILESVQRVGLRHGYLESQVFTPAVVAGRNLIWHRGASTSAYGDEAKNRHFVRAFLRNETPALALADGLEVVKLLMAGYLSAEQGKTIDFPPEGLDTFIPTVARGTWQPRR